MPRDKTLSHIRVNRAIKEEFLAKGFEDASIRSIAARAGMTSAGLYRHYSDKEAMFNAMVEPLVEEINEWTHKHVGKRFDLMKEGADGSGAVSESIVDLVRDVIIPRKDEFKLLMTCSRGTRYENYIHEYAVENQKIFMKSIEYLKSKGYPTVDIDEEELHMLLSSYLTACFEPVIHEYDESKLDRYLNTIQEFFMPGWLKIMGLK